MMALAMAAALAAQGGFSERHEHGLPFFALSVRRHLPGREMEFELFEIGEGADSTLLIERRVSQIGGESRHDVTTRECSNLGEMVRRLTSLAMPSLHVEGIGAAPVEAGYPSARTTYEFQGFVRHPNGEMGELSLTSYDADGPDGGSDPLREWSDSLAAVFEGCLETG